MTSNSKLIEILLIDSSKTLYDGLNQLNSLLSVEKISRLILFVQNQDKQVIGSITDGDIRRALVKNKDLNQPVIEICNKNFLYSDKVGEFLDLSYYRKKNIKIVPILDENKRLVNVLDLENTKAQLPLECMIMAGGRGKRLSPLTDTIPKPMLPLGGKPIIENNIDRLIQFGIRKIYISVKYLGDQIKDYFGDGSSKGIEIEYIDEDKPLGTGGALSLVNEFKTDHVLLMNSDLFTNVDFEEMYLTCKDQDADMVIASTEYKVDVPYAVFDCENGQSIKGFQEKPSFKYHSNAGIYIMKKEVISKIPKNEFYDITDLMDLLIEENKNLIHCPIKGYWIDIGKPVDYINAQELVKHF